MTDLTKLTISQMHSGLLAKDFSSVELTKAHLEKIKKENAEINAFVLVTEDLAIKRAKESDKKIAEGKNLSKLTGIPYAAKDLYCTEGVRTTACSRALHDFVPGYESTVTKKLMEAGAVMLGKTNMDEFAMGSANIYSCFGVVKNPAEGAKGKDLVAGGSSGGSAAAVSANFAPFSLGSDTGGSVRQPASFCGLFGLRPTYGRCSRWGMVAFASSLDQAGIFSRTAEDNACVLECISGYDPKDSTCAHKDAFRYQQDSDIKGLKVGIPKQCRMKDLSAEITDIWDSCAQNLKSLGAEIIEIDLPDIESALSVYYIICTAEASSNLARYDGIRYGSNPELKPANIEEMYEKYRSYAFGKEVKKRIIAGTYALSSAKYQECYAKAKLVQQMIADNYQKAFKEVDAILNPTAPNQAFKIDADLDPLEMYINDIFTVPTSIAKLPCISVPFGTSKEGLPIGMHFTANYFKENMLFKFATALEDFEG